MFQHAGIQDLYRFDFEVQSYQREHQAFEILYQVVEASQTLRVPRLIDVQKRTGLGRGERYVLVADHDFQFLATDAIRLGPKRVVLLHDLGVLDDAFQLLHHALMHVRLFADHSVVFVIGVVGVSQLAVGPKFELEKLVAELALVADVIAYVEVRRHPGARLSINTSHKVA